jgi:hypothetical protein
MKFSDGCIAIKGEKTRLGYVRLWNGGNRILAHRKVYESVNGAVPQGFELDHLCKNRWCCNPNHLQVVTHKENCRRSDAAKISKSEACQIRRLYQQGYSASKIAFISGLTRQMVWRIGTGKAW